jgi:hypothetical protein
MYEFKILYDTHAIKQDNSVHFKLIIYKIIWSMINIQYTYIVGKYKIYLYEL